MAQYKLPATKQNLGTIELDRFDGVDFTNSPSKCSRYRSPDATNFIRITPGKVGKRTGWFKEHTFTGKRINGEHVLTLPSGDIEFIHAGNTIYQRTASSFVEKYTTANDAKSRSVMCGGKLVIFDGLKALIADNTGITAADSNPYIPKTFTGRAPTGGGVMLESVNLLSSKRKEGFYGTANDTVYQLSVTNIDSVDKVEKMASDGTFADIPTTDYIANTTAGTVTFTTAPGISPSAGKDNVIIHISKTVAGYADRINKCTMCTLYGVNGGQDRVFATGNADYPGRDFFCQQRDPTYWSDLWYSVLGDEKTPILNYSIVDSKLTAFKASGENNVNVYQRSGELEKVTETVNGVEVVYYDPSFKIVGTYQSEDILAAYSFQMFDNEPIYLTARGIHALTLVSLTNERNSELRSYYLNGTQYRGLLRESNLKDAHSVVYNGFYILCVNGSCYILDSLQSVAEQGTIDSNSRKQYEGFYWDNVPARVMWVHNGVLCFGTENGDVCAFYTELDSTASYSDDGTAVSCSWKTSHLRGADPLNKTTLINVGFIMSAFISTSITINVMKDGAMRPLVNIPTAGRFFSYEPFDYGALSYSGDSTEQTYNKKIRIMRNVDKFQLEVANNGAEPFAIEYIAVDYRQGGKYKNRG